MSNKLYLEREQREIGFETKLRRNFHKEHYSPSFNCDCGDCWKHQDIFNCISCDFDISKIALIDELKPFFEGLDKEGSSIFDTSRVWEKQRDLEIDDNSFEDEVFEYLQEKYNCQILFHSTDMGSYVVLHNDFAFDENGNTLKRHLRNHNNTILTNSMINHYVCCDKAVYLTDQEKSFLQDKLDNITFGGYTVLWDCKTCNMGTCVIYSKYGVSNQ